jgi:hypothetical protein
MRLAGVFIAFIAIENIANENVANLKNEIGLPALRQTLEAA